MIFPPDESNPFRISSLSKPAVLLIGALVFLNLYDVVYHLLTEHSLSAHQISEAVLVSSITVFAVLMVIRQRRTLGRAGEEIRKIQAEIEEVRREAKRSADELQRFREENRDAFDTLRHAMNDQFKRWRFTHEEKRAARLIIQGLTFREIAGRLEKSEKTIRNQSLSIYEKSGMTGRNDLAAFFLLDILDIDE